MFGCAQPPDSLEGEPSGAWRNEVEKIDYRFGPNDNLEVVGEDSLLNNLECTYLVESRELETRIVNMQFKCSKPDLAGYAESHEFIYSEDYNSFVDTMHIKGVSSRRYDGSFIKLVP